MFNIWGDVIVMVGMPILMILVAWGVSRLSARHQRGEVGQ